MYTLGHPHSLSQSVSRTHTISHAQTHTHMHARTHTHSTSKKHHRVVVVVVILYPLLNDSCFCSHTHQSTLIAFGFLLGLSLSLICNHIRTFSFRINICVCTNIYLCVCVPLFLPLSQCVCMHVCMYMLWMINHCMVAKQSSSSCS